MESAMSEETYLGDGLYASFDGFMFTLRAPRGNIDHWVGLEPAVMKAFDDFRREAIARARAEGEKIRALNEEIERARAEDK
jgi:hypothetical protein